MLDRLRQRRQRWVAGDAPDLAIAGIDQEEPSGKAGGAGDHALPDAVRLGRGADQRERRRRQQRRQAVPASGIGQPGGFDGARISH